MGRIDDLNSKSNRCKIIYSIIPSDNFLEALKNTNKIRMAELFTSKKFIGSEKKREKVSEVFFPIMISIIITITYSYYNLSEKALIELRTLLPSTISILIGFSITCLTIIITSDNKSINFLKTEETDGRRITNYSISLYQWLLIMFVHIIIAEIILLIFVFFSSFVIQIWKPLILRDILLMVQVGLLIHIFLVLIRNVGNLYFVFYRDE